MSKTYTIAYDELLLACIPDGGDLESELSRQESEAGIEIDRDRIRIESGLLLVDSTKDGDEVIWSGFSLGRLSNENGEEFEYAVRR